MFINNNRYNSAVIKWNSYSLQNSKLDELGLGMNFANNVCLCIA